ncbi:hypothetical protein ACN3XK_09055 [Actinomadura welshii]
MRGFAGQDSSARFSSGPASPPLHAVAASNEAAATSAQDASGNGLRRRGQRP